jgi:predicted patatin/cPLA2 family phospholipase
MQKKYKLALVVEGGAMRGIFSTGVLDTFIKHNFNPFDICLGVSAGANNLSSFLGEMYKRNYYIYTTYSLDKNFISIKKFILEGKYIDIDWLWDITIKNMRLDLGKIINNKCKFYIGVTNAITGKNEYINPNLENLENVIKASSALPLFYKNPIKIEKNFYFDGGISDPIPVKQAVKFGAETIVVLRSRKREFKMKQQKNLVSKFILRDYDELNKTIENRHSIYNNQIDFIRKKHKNIKIIEVCPPNGFKTSRLTKDKDILENDYLLGVNEGKKLLKEMKAIV